MLVIVDGGFCDGAALLPLQDHGVSRHSLTRTMSNLKRRTLEMLGPGEELIEVEPYHYARSREPGRFPSTATIRPRVLRKPNPHRRRDRSLDGCPRFARRTAICLGIMRAIRSP